MVGIEEAYQFCLEIEQKLNKRFEEKKKGKAQGGTGGGKYFGSRNGDQKKNDEVGPSQNRRGDNFYYPYDHMMNKEEEEEEGLYKGLGEVVLEELISNVVKKGIETMSVHNMKEGRQEEMKAMHE